MVGDGLPIRSSCPPVIAAAIHSLCVQLGVMVSHSSTYLLTHCRHSFPVLYSCLGSRWNTSIIIIYPHSLVYIPPLPVLVLIRTICLCHHSPSRSRVSANLMLCKRRRQQRPPLSHTSTDPRMPCLGSWDRNRTRCGVQLATKSSTRWSK